MKSSWLFSGVCAAVLLWSVPSSAKTIWAENGHELAFNGYFRIGTGTSSGQHDQACFWAPGASAKYRLGNECENYGSLGFHARAQLPENPLVEYIKYEFRTPREGPYGEPLIADEPLMNYVELGGLLGTPAKSWIGRRESFLKDVHILDYNYMNIKGDGVGIYDFPAGVARLSAAYYVERLHETNDAGLIHQHNFDVGVNDIPLNQDGTLAIEVRYAQIDDDQSGSDGIHRTDGHAIAIRHDQNNVFGGHNTFVFQYGNGAARAAFGSPAEPWWVGDALSDETRQGQLEDAETLRFLNTYLTDRKNWSLMGVAIFESRQSKDFDFVDQRWFSIGARPIWYLDDHFRLTSEVGLDYVIDRARETKGYLFKKTVAVEWAPERTFFSRPALRGYVTHANWSNSFAGQVGWPRYQDDTEAWSAGVQIEYWW